MLTAALLLAVVSCSPYAAAQPAQITGTIMRGGDPASGDQVVIVRCTVAGVQTQTQRPSFDAPASDVITYVAEDGTFALPWPAEAEWVLLAGRGEDGRFSTVQLREPGEVKMWLTGKHERQHDPIDWQAKGDSTNCLRCKLSDHTR